MISREDLEESFNLAKEARIQHEDNPSAETEETYSVCRGNFRAMVIKSQRESLDVLRAEYFGLARALQLIWQEMATLDGWLRRQKLSSPLPDDFIKSVRLPALSKDLNDLVCGTEADGLNFDFEACYSEDARKIFDGTYWYRSGEYETQD